MATDDYPSIWESAHAVIAAVGRDNGDPESRRAGLLDALGPFVERPGLFSLGVRRPGNHIDNSKYVYYDGELSITIDQLSQGAGRAAGRDPQLRSAGGGNFHLHGRRRQLQPAPAPLQRRQEHLCRRAGRQAAESGLTYTAPAR